MKSKFFELSAEMQEKVIAKLSNVVDDAIESVTEESEEWMFDCVYDSLQATFKNNSNIIIKSIDETEYEIIDKTNNTTAVCRFICDYDKWVVYDKPNTELKETIVNELTDVVEKFDCTIEATVQLD